MPPLFGGRSQRQAQILAHPANKAKALSSQQQGGASGTIPGTSTSPLQVAATHGMIQTYPALAISPNGDQVAGVGHAVLNNDGNPVVVMGNLNAIGGGVDCPANFQDGAFAFVDIDGNLTAGYSQPTGLWGFGGGVQLDPFFGPSHVTADAWTNVSAGAAYATFAAVTATPPAWMDNFGEILTPGLYAVVLEIQGVTPPSVAGKFATCEGPFSSTAYVPLDALFDTYASHSPSRAKPIDIGAFTDGDLPYTTSFGIAVPASATGCVVKVRCNVNLLAH